MQNLLDPAILFFVFGIFAGMLKSNLEIPPQIARFLSLYLLMALGLKGGFALSESGLTAEVSVSLACAIGLAVVVPAIGYALLRRFLNGFDAAAIAATYGSVSAVTFITAVQFLDGRGIAYGGHMAAAMALMESPAIVMAVLFAKMARQHEDAARGRVQTPATAGTHDGSIGGILKESFTDGAQLLLLGAMVVGLVTGESGKVAMQPFTGDLFKGMLSFFLLDMGLQAAKKHGRAEGKVAVAAGLCHLRPSGSRRAGAGAGDGGGHVAGRCGTIDGAGRQRVVYRRAGGDPARNPGGESVDLFRHVAGADVPVQHSGRHPALHLDRAVLHRIEPVFTSRVSVETPRSGCRENSTPARCRW